MAYKDKDRKIAWWRARRNKYRQIIEDSKAVPCMDCGVQYPHYVMQFDHVSGVKRFTIAAASQYMPRLEDLVKEIAKCEVVCGNCHAERTYQRGLGVPRDGAGERCRPAFRQEELLFNFMGGELDKRASTVPKTVGRPEAAVEHDRPPPANSEENDDA